MMGNRQKVERVKKIREISAVGILEAKRIEYYLWDAQLPITADNVREIQFCVKKVNDVRDRHYAALPVLLKPLILASSEERSLSPYEIRKMLSDWDKCR